MDKLTVESLKARVETEREILQPLQAKLESAYMKRMCQFALDTLRDVEYLFTQPTNDSRHWEPALILLDVAIKQREVLAELVSKFGYNALAIPHRQKGN